MATLEKWKLKRFGRFVPGSKDEGGKQWKVFESSDGNPELMLTIVESGHMLVTQGHELLEGLSLLDTSYSINVQQKSDNLIFRLNIKGESRIMRMQFGGSAGAEECTSAVLKLKEYLPVSSQEGLAPAPSYAPTPNHPLAEITTSAKQTGSGEATGTEAKVVQGSLPIKLLTQHFLGEHALALPLVYRHCSLSHGNLEPFLRLCLLDPSFPAFVEEVEKELKKLLQD